MISKKEKISHHQLIFIFFSLAYTLNVRAATVAMSTNAKQAAWLSPFFTFIVMIVTFLLIGRIYKSVSNKELSLFEIMCKIFGKTAAKIVSLFYCLYLTLLLADCIRFYSLRITVTTFNMVDRIYFIFFLLLIVAIALEIGLGLIARMSEIIFPLLFIFFIVTFLLLIPQMKFEFLWPVSYKDIVPAAKGSIFTSSVGLIYPLFFFFGDKIKDKDRIKKSGYKISIMYSGLVFMLAISTVGTLGYKFIEKMQVPFIIVTKHINLFDTLERLESFTLAQWILSDFIMVSILVYIVLNLMKSIFALKAVQSIKNIYLVFLGVLSLAISINAFRLSEIERNFLLPLNYIFGLAIPFILYFMGKLRKKI